MDHMKTQLLQLSFLLLAGFATSVHAQTVWTYEVIGTDNTPKIATKPPMDISYPPPNVVLPMYSGNNRLETVLTPREEAVRINAPKLIIMLGAGAGIL